MRVWFQVCRGGVGRCSNQFTRMGGELAKSVAKAKKPPQDNVDAVRRMAEERRRTDARFTKPGKFEAKRNRGLEEAFLDGLREGWSVRKSAYAVSVDTQTVYNWRNASEASKQDDGTYRDDFAVRWQSAVRDGVDVLEDEAHRRAVVGVEKPVYQQGVMVGTVTEYSDNLLGLKLRGKRPEVYNTERHEMSGPGGGAITMSVEVEFVDAKGKK